MNRYTCEYLESGRTKQGSSRSASILEHFYNILIILFSSHFIKMYEKNILCRTWVLLIKTSIIDVILELKGLDRKSVV